MQEARTQRLPLGIPGRTQASLSAPALRPVSGFRYRDAMEIDGCETIVRESDGLHLNAAGAREAADAVLAAIDRDFTC